MLQQNRGGRQDMVRTLRDHHQQADRRAFPAEAFDEGLSCRGTKVGGTLLRGGDATLLDAGRRSETSAVFR